MAASWEVKEHLCCSMCLDTLNNSVTLQCGHNLCTACVNIYCDQADCGVVCSCPLCRQIFTPRPVLKKNSVLDDLPGKTSIARQATPPDEVFEEASDESQLEPEPKTRQDFLLYFCPLSLDASTVSANLLLSEDNMKVSWNEKTQKSKVSWSEKVDKCLEKFTRNDQVLCTEGLSGVCYWEVEWQGPRVEVAVCYKRADLGKSSFGHTDHAWCISLSNTGCSFWHSETGIKIGTPRSSTVGVYLNHKGGSLSFYSVEDSGQMMLLHRVQTTFCQPLYPGFMLSRGASVRILSLK